MEIRKNIKRFLFFAAGIFLVVIFSFSPTSAVFVAVALDCPANLTVSCTDGCYTAAWSAVSGVSFYNIYINGTAVKLNYFSSANPCSYEISKWVSSPNAYKVEVCAVSDGSQTSEFASYEFTVTEKLDAPSNLSASENVLSWDAVPNAAEYSVAINNVGVAIQNETSLDLSNFLAVGGFYSISVSALPAENSFYTASNAQTVNYDFSETLPAPENFSIVFYGGKCLLSWTKSIGATKYYWHVGGSGWISTTENLQNDCFCTTENQADATDFVYDGAVFYLVAEDADGNISAATALTAY